MSIECLYGAAKPTIVLLHEERHCRMVKTYTVELADKALRPGPWSQADVGAQCCMVAAVPGDSLAALAIGEVSIAYYRSGESKVVPTAPSAVSAYATIDDGRVLVGSRRDERGLLSMLVISRDEEGRVQSLDIEDLGVCSVPSSLAYLDDGVRAARGSFDGGVVVGCCACQLIRIPPPPTLFIFLIAGGVCGLHLFRLSVGAAQHRSHPIRIVCGGD
jgi:hypothetical protein